MSQFATLRIRAEQSRPFSLGSTTGLQKICLGCTRNSVSPGNSRVRLSSTRSRCLDRASAAELARAAATVLGGSPKGAIFQRILYTKFGISWKYDGPHFQPGEPSAKAAATEGVWRDSKRQPARERRRGEN